MDTSAGISPFSTDSVLVRWSVDGWFYSGKVKAALEDDLFDVQFDGGSRAIKGRDEVVPFVNVTRLEEGDYCMALLASESCFGPAVVESCTSGTISVLLHEVSSLTLDRADACLITRSSYLAFRNFIEEREKKMHNRMVLAFRENLRRYGRAVVKKKIPNDARNFELWFGDGHTEALSWTFMVPVAADAELRELKKNQNFQSLATDGNGRPLHRGDAVVAPFPNSHLFAMSRVFNIVQKSHVALVFEQDIKSTIPAEECYWLDLKQYQRATLACAKTITKPTLQLPEVDCSLREKFHKKK